MTFAQTFYLFILPALIAVGAFGWIAYDRSRASHRLHPGE
jgi:hypothetical protein